MVCIRIMNKYVIQKSKEPDDEGDYVLFHETSSKRGMNCQRVFKGTYKECLERKREILNEKVR